MLCLSQAQNEGYMMRIFVFRDACFSSPLMCGESNLLVGGLTANQGCAGSPQPLSLQAVMEPFHVCSAIGGKCMQGTRVQAGAGVCKGGVGWGRACVERRGRTREQPVKHLCVCRLQSGGELRGPGRGQAAVLSAVHPVCCRSLCIMSALPNSCFLHICSL